MTCSLISRVAAATLPAEQRPAPHYVIVYEDPWELDAAVRIIRPDAGWLALAMRGGVIPPVEAYWAMRVLLTAEFPGEEAISIVTRGDRVGDARADAVRRGGRIVAERIVEHELNRAEPLGPLSEEQAMEYLAKVWMPARVRLYAGNRRIWRFVRSDRIPSDRSFRPAWRSSL